MSDPVSQSGAEKARLDALLALSRPPTTAIGDRDG